jgi:DNA polymerase III subunit alpha
LAEWNVVRLEEVEGQRNGKEIAVAALVVGVRPMRSKKGARWAIFTIQDMTGVQELLAFPESFAKHEQTLKPGMPLLLKVRVQIEEAGTRLSLQEARRIADIAERAAAQEEFRVRLTMASMKEETIDVLEKLFARAPGTSQVVFELESPDGTVAVVPSQQRVTATPELTESVRRVRENVAAA